MKCALFCSCGAGAEGEMPDKAFLKFRELWELVHAGPGHGPCDRGTARAAFLESDGAQVRESGDGKPSLG